MAASKDYSGTPLSQKLGAKPGVGVVVFFTTTRDELEQRFESLKATLDPADGLWIAWPKKAAKIDGDLTFEAVQEIGPRARARRQQELLDRRALAGAALRLPAHGSAAVKSWALRARSQGSSSQRIRSGSIAARLRQVARQPLEADDVDDRMRRRHEQGVAAELAERAHGVDRALRRAALALEHEAAHRRVDRREVAVEKLLGLVRLGGDVRALAELEDRLERRRRIAPGARDDEPVVRRGPERLGVELAEDIASRASLTSSPWSARPAATAHV